MHEPSEFATLITWKEGVGLSRALILFVAVGQGARIAALVVDTFALNATEQRKERLFVVGVVLRLQSTFQPWQ